MSLFAHPARSIAATAQAITSFMGCSPPEIRQCTVSAIEGVPNAEAL
jgi:hypothetical protein